MILVKWTLERLRSIVKGHSDRLQKWLRDGEPAAIDCGAVESTVSRRLSLPNQLALPANATWFIVNRWDVLPIAIIYFLQLTSCLVSSKSRSKAIIQFVETVSSGSSASPL